MQWSWWYGMSEKAYQQRFVKLTEKDTFKQIHLQIFNDIEGRPIYQAVFKKDLDQTSLDKLDLSGSQTTDAALARRLEGLTSLRELRLQNTNITDAGLAHLKGLIKLKDLRLSRTKITDAGLVHLKGLTKLKELRLMQTQITAEGVNELKQALPNCRIIWRDRFAR